MLNVRKSIALASAVVFIVAAYVFYPMWTLERLQTAIADRDFDTIEALVDWIKLRENILAELQAASTYDALNKQGSVGTQLGTLLGTMVGSTISERMITSLVSPAGARMLLGRELPKGKFAQDTVRSLLLPAVESKHFVSLTVYRANFSIGDKTKFAGTVVLELQSGGWRVTRIGLRLPKESSQSEAPVTECDKYAASPTDPERKVVGVLRDKLDPKLAIATCSEAVRNYPDSNRLAFQLARAYHVAADYTNAIPIYERLAITRQHALSQYNLALMYAQGSGVPKDERRASQLMQRAAEAGLAIAQMELGVMFFWGLGVQKDMEQAYQWARRAAQQGLGTAQTAVGHMYFAGDGVKADPAKALHWFRKAAESGDAQGQASLGMMLATGAGVERNDAEAFAWFQKAAEQGLPLDEIYAAIAKARKLEEAK